MILGKPGLNLIQGEMVRIATHATIILIGELLITSS